MDIETHKIDARQLARDNVKVEPIDYVEVLVGESKDEAVHVQPNKYQQTSSTDARFAITYLSYATYQNDIYQCNECTFKCSQKFSLRKHLKTHLKPYRCNKCDYKSATMHSLQKHFISHMPEKPFKCPQCIYTGSRKLYLDVHMRTHFNSSFKCSVCEYTASHRSTLTKHFNVVHLLISE